MFQNKTKFVTLKYKMENSLSPSASWFFLNFELVMPFIELHNQVVKFAISTSCLQDEYECIKIVAYPPFQAKRLSCKLLTDRMFGRYIIFEFSTKKL